MTDTDNIERRRTGDRRDLLAIESALIDDVIRLTRERDDLIEALREWKAASLSGMDPFDGPEYAEWCDKFETRIDALIAKYQPKDAKP